MRAGMEQVREYLLSNGGVVDVTTYSVAWMAAEALRRAAGRVAAVVELEVQAAADSHSHYPPTHTEKRVPVP